MDNQLSPFGSYEVPNSLFRASPNAVRFVIAMFQLLGIRNVQSRHEVGFWEVSGDGLRGNWYAVGLVMKRFEQDFHLGLQMIIAELTWNGWIEPQLKALYKTIYLGDTTDVDATDATRTESSPTDPNAGGGI